jgi:hypothetical protein
MRRLAFAALLLAIVTTAPRARAADDLISQLATCQASWFESKEDAAQTQKFAEAFNAAFVEKSDPRRWVPKSKVLVVGLPAVQAFPQSVGMGVGFSVLVDAPLDKARAAVEKTVGKSLKNCETGEGMHTCDLAVAEKRTVMVMSTDADKTKTLVGCYYFYEK